MEQRDIAEDLGVIPPSLPEIVWLEDIAASPPVAPEQIIAGVLHRGCKMLLGGTSKSNKSWCLLDLAVSVASGQPWWGHVTFKGPVLYINFELQPWAITERLTAILGHRPECKIPKDGLAIWNLRGRNGDLALLRPKLEEQLDRHEFALIILDPAYKLLGNRDENANGEVADLMNEFEALAQRTGSALVIAHHFAKGDSTAKSAIDRMSGAGAWARDPDSIIVLTPHEEPDCFTVTSILRNLPQLPEFVLQWDFPLMKVATDLNPEALRRPQSKNKSISDKDFMENIITSEGQFFGKIMERAETELRLSRATAARFLKRLVTNGLVKHQSGLYWR